MVPSALLAGLGVKRPLEVARREEVRTMASALCPPHGPGTPAARRYLLVPFLLRRLPEKELAECRLFGDHDGALPYASAFFQKVG